MTIPQEVKVTADKWIRQPAYQHLLRQIRMDVYKEKQKGATEDEINSALVMLGENIIESIRN
jgi:hypothetical protein